jgi:putative DNA primase/helicase
MVGKRLCYGTETEHGKKFAENTIKDWTGGDTLCARRVYQDEFQFIPKFKLLISGNNEPAIENCDPAMRGRFYIIHFDQEFTGTKADNQLDEKIKDEWSGILQWAIDGCLDWQKHGLIIPDKVRAATDRYFDRQDIFAQWLEQWTDRGPEFEDTSTDIYKSWAAFCKGCGEHPGSQKSLAEKLSRAGFEGPAVTRRDGRGVRIWSGLKVLTT